MSTVSELHDIACLAQEKKIQKAKNTLEPIFEAMRESAQKGSFFRDFTVKELPSDQRLYLMSLGFEISFIDGTDVRVHWHNRVEK